MTASTFQPEDFEDWFAGLRNSELMALIFQLYKYDQFGKMTNEALTVSLLVKQQRKKQPVSSDVLDKLSDYTAVGLIDDILAARARRKSS